MALRVAFIGTGKNRDKPGLMGYAMAYRHADSYRLLDDVEMVAVADLSEENGRAFCEVNDIADLFADYHEMLAQVKPDIVSICTWPHLHEQMVVDCARAGVGMIYCEKPMASTIGAARNMVRVCEEEGCQLYFNHQRRYGKSFGGARKLLDDGVIGDLDRIEWSAGNLYDYGSHNFDMANYFNNETPCDWAICQVDYREESLAFGQHIENQALALLHYENDVWHVIMTGEGAGAIPCHHRCIGSEGVIELGSERGALSYRTYSTGDWVVVDTDGEGMHANSFIDRAVSDSVESFRRGEWGMMNMHNALNTTEQIFACWESARQRARVDIPIETEGNPLAEMVESGALNPTPAPEE